MSFTEKPPMLRGSPQEQINAIRDYLFRMVGSLDEAITANSTGSVGRQITRADGTKIYVPAGKDEATIDLVRKNAQELRSLIIKSADEVREYADSKVEEYDQRYVAESEYGTFTENIDARIETTARGVVDSYRYGSSIQSMQDSIGLIQSFFTTVSGEIRRGIIEDPDTGEYVTGIAISQSLTFSGECGPDDAHNPGDGNTYYYLTQGQTFGLYTSTGWQFWIDGQKKGWFDSLDGMLHVANIVVEDTLNFGGHWRMRSTGTAGRTFELFYLGG